MIESKKIIANALSQHANSCNEEKLIFNEEKCTINYPEQFKQLLKVNPATKVLHILLVIDRISDEDVINLISYLKTENGKKIKELNILSSYLNVRQAEAVLINLIRCQHKIESLSFWENDLSGDLSFLNKINSLKGSLKKLCLADNIISSNIHHMVSIINTCHLLETISIDNTNIDDEDLKQLCMAIENHPKLHTITLTYNKKITNKSLIFLENLLRNNKNLICIDLLGTNINYSKIQQLQEQHKEVALTFLGKPRYVPALQM